MALDETPTKGTTVMSDATAPSKKSILTSAMEKVAAAKAGETEENENPTSNEVAAKRLLKRAGLALVGTAVAVTAVILISNKLGTEDETSDEETTTED